MPNINDFDRLYRRTKKAVGVTNGAVRISLDPLGPGLLRVLTHVTAENKSNDYDKCRIGIQHAGRDYYLDELTTIIKDELAVSRSDILLTERDAFFAEFTGTTDADELVMSCIGWSKDLK